MLNPTEAELLAASAARDHLLAYAIGMVPAYETPPHIRYIAEKLHAVKDGSIKRLMIFCPPRHGKSALTSELFPAWYLGHHPGHQVLFTTYGQDLADGFGRKVRNFVADARHQRAFPDCRLAHDSQSAKRFNTTAGGVYYAVGAGGAITGRGADLLIIDDPLKSREEADSRLIRDKLWDWYASTAYTRLMPGGAIVVIQCMTGDTPVMMDDGSHRPLRDIRPGDLVATYDSGRLSSSRVVNWTPSGIDMVYRITTSSGISVRANARHPFLVDVGGRPAWVRLGDLRPGHAIYRVSADGKAAGYARRETTESRPDHGAAGTPQQPPHGARDFTPDAITEIVEDGFEEVFDLQVEGTENFIANGLVSHNTRWHEDDLAGRILRGGERWCVVNLPAIAEGPDGLGRNPGEPLWPQRYDRDALQRIRETIGEREFAALYQQRPSPLEGALFRRSWIQYGEPPRQIRIGMGVDLAISSKETSDYTAIVVMGRDEFGKLYVIDAIRDRVDFPNALRMIRNAADKWRPHSILVEQVAYQAAVVQELLRNTTLPIKGVTPDRDKVSRAQPLALRYEQGLVWHSRNLPSFLESEMLAFPNGEHDDCVDALAYAYQGLMRMSAAGSIAPVEREARFAVFDPLMGF